MEDRGDENQEEEDKDGAKEIELDLRLLKLFHLPSWHLGSYKRKRKAVVRKRALECHSMDVTLSPIVAVFIRQGEGIPQLPLWTGRYFSYPVYFRGCVFVLSTLCLCTCGPVRFSSLLFRNFLLFLYSYWVYLQVWNRRQSLRFALTVKGKFNLNHKEFDKYVCFKK